MSSTLKLTKLCMSCTLKKQTRKQKKESYTESDFAMACHSPPLNKVKKRGGATTHPQSYSFPPFYVTIATPQIHYSDSLPVNLIMNIGCFS